MTRSTPPTLYDEDFFAWTQQQAAALRRAAALDKDIDIEHVAEEIEDLGKREIREVSSFLRLLLQHLLKIQADPKAPAVAHWRSELLEFRQRAIDAFTPAMRQLVDVGAIWKRATNAAADDLREHGLRLRTADDCPFSLEDLMAASFDVKAALAKLAKAAEPPPS